MVQQITAYKADDGSLHEDKCKAAQRNIVLLIQRSPLAENQPYARRLAAWFTSDAETILTALGAYHDACPQGVTDEGTDSAFKGPVTGTRDWREDVIIEHHGEIPADETGGNMP